MKKTAAILFLPTSPELSPAEETPQGIQLTRTLQRGDYLKLSETLLELKDLGMDQIIFRDCNSHISDFHSFTEDHCQALDREWEQSLWTNPRPQGIHPLGLPYEPQLQTTAVIMHLGTILGFGELSSLAKGHINSENIDENYRPRPQLLPQGKFFPLSEVNVSFSLKLLPLMLLPEKIGNSLPQFNLTLCGMIFRSWADRNQMGISLGAAECRTDSTKGPENPSAEAQQLPLLSQLAELLITLPWEKSTPEEFALLLNQKLLSSRKGSQLYQCGLWQKAWLKRLGLSLKSKEKEPSEKPLPFQPSPPVEAEKIHEPQSLENEEIRIRRDETKEKSSVNPELSPATQKKSPEVNTERENNLQELLRSLVTQEIKQLRESIPSLSTNSEKANLPVQSKDQGFTPSKKAPQPQPEEKKTSAPRIQQQQIQPFQPLRMEGGRRPNRSKIHYFG